MADDAENQIAELRRWFRIEQETAPNSVCLTLDPYQITVTTPPYPDRRLMVSELPRVEYGLQGWRSRAVRIGWESEVTHGVCRAVVEHHGQCECIGDVIGTGLRLKRELLRRLATYDEVA